LKEMYRVAERLRAMLHDDGARWVYLKGGHLPGDEAIDLLHDGDKMIELRAERIATRNTHGTGCTLSAALATLIVQTGDVVQAARQAEEGLTHANVAAADLFTTFTHYGRASPAPHSTPTARSEDNARPRRISSAG